MSVSAVNNSYSGVNNAKSTTISSESNSLSMNDFFKLLAAELQNQNAMDPVSNTEFISQMAQFSTLTQMKEMNNSIQMTYAASLVGKTVDVQTIDKSGKKTSASGVVDSVNFENGVAYLQIESKSFPVSSLITVKNSKEGTTE